MDARPGTYALVLFSPVERVLDVGRLGPVLVPQGFLAYVGSAFGPGGVSARVSHHRRPTARPYWHIDYLRETIRLEEVWYSYDPDRPEHAWARALALQRGATCPVRRFGASDCRCPSHLLHFAARPSRRALDRCTCATRSRTRW